MRTGPRSKQNFLTCEEAGYVGRRICIVPVFNESSYRNYYAAIF